MLIIGGRCHWKLDFYYLHFIDRLKVMRDVFWRVATRFAVCFAEKMSDGGIIGVETALSARMLINILQICRFILAGQRFNWLAKITAV
jgi:hypothetical protein